MEDKKVGPSLRNTMCPQLLAIQITDVQFSQVLMKTKMNHMLLCRQTLGQFYTSLTAIKCQVTS